MPGPASGGPAPQAAGDDAPILEARRCAFGKRIGRGGFAVVYAGTLDGTVPIALKVLHPVRKPPGPRAAQMLERLFLSEARACATLVHRNLAHCLGVVRVEPGAPGAPSGLPAPTWAMALEYCDSSTLRDRITAGMVRRGSYSTAEALGWLVDVAEALHFLHTQNPTIIHRDIKAENILLKAEDGRLVAKLADLGLHASVGDTRSVMLRRRGALPSVDGSSAAFVAITPAASEARFGGAEAHGGNSDEDGSSDGAEEDDAGASGLGGCACEEERIDVYVDDAYMRSDFSATGGGPDAAAGAAAGAAGSASPPVAAQAVAGCELRAAPPPTMPPPLSAPDARCASAADAAPAPLSAPSAARAFAAPAREARPHGASAHHHMHWPLPSALSDPAATIGRPVGAQAGPAAKPRTNQVLPTSQAANSEACGGACSAPSTATSLGSDAPPELAPPAATVSLAQQQAPRCAPCAQQHAPPDPDPSLRGGTAALHALSTPAPAAAAEPVAAPPQPAPAPGRNPQPQSHPHTSPFAGVLVPTDVSSAGHSQQSTATGGWGAASLHAPELPPVPTFAPGAEAHAGPPGAPHGFEGTSVLAAAAAAAAALAAPASMDSPLTNAMSGSAVAQRCSLDLSAALAAVGIRYVPGGRGHDVFAVLTTTSPDVADGGGTSITGGRGTISGGGGIIRIGGASTDVGYGLGPVSGAGGGGGGSPAQPHVTVADAVVREQRWSSALFRSSGAQGGLLADAATGSPHSHGGSSPARVGVLHAAALEDAPPASVSASAAAAAAAAAADTDSARAAVRQQAARHPPPSRRGLTLLLPEGAPADGAANAIGPRSPSTPRGSPPVAAPASAGGQASGPDLPQLQLSAPKPLPAPAAAHSPAPAGGVSGLAVLPPLLLSSRAASPQLPSPTSELRQSQAGSGNSVSVAVMPERSFRRLFSGTLGPSLDASACNSGSGGTATPGGSGGGAGPCGRAADGPARHRRLPRPASSALLADARARGSRAAPARTATLGHLGPVRVMSGAHAAEAAASCGSPLAAPTSRMASSLAPPGAAGPWPAPSALQRAASAQAQVPCAAALGTSPASQASPPPFRRQSSRPAWQPPSERMPAGAPRPCRAESVASRGGCGEGALFEVTLAASFSSHMRRMASITEMLNAPSGTRLPEHEDYQWVFGLTGQAGSATYMAPEVFTRQPYNQSADVFSLGVLLYELLARELLLIAYVHTSRGDAVGIREPLDYARKVSEGFRPPRPSRFTDEQWALVEQCWHQDPCERPGVGEVLARLRAMQAAAQEADAAPRPSPRTSLRQRSAKAEPLDKLPAGATAQGVAEAPDAAVRSCACQCAIS